MYMVDEKNKEALAAYLFHQGTNFRAQDYLGAHLTEKEYGKYTYTFRVWAPNAEAVCVVGDFTTGTRAEMTA